MISDKDLISKIDNSSVLSKKLPEDGLILFKAKVLSLSDDKKSKIFNKISKENDFFNKKKRLKNLSKEDREKNMVFIEKYNKEVQEMASKFKIKIRLKNEEIGKDEDLKFEQELLEELQKI